MTTVELAQHLLICSRLDDTRTAPPSQKQELALLMTQAVAEYFRLAPACHRRTTLSESRPAQETVSVTLVNGSSVVTGTPFLPRQRGCSIQFPDGLWNEIVAPDQLLHDATQATGTYDCTVFSDALAFDDFQIDRVMTDPEVTTDTGSSWLLSPLTPVGARSVSRPSVLDLMSAGDRVPQRQRDTSDWPSYYWSEHIGGSIAVSTDALFQFRFWPAPRSAYKVAFDAEILPDTYRIGDITSVSTVPVPDSHAQELLVPLARGKLARSPLFDKTKADKADLIAAANEARAACGLLPSIFGPSHVAVLTEPGW